MSSSLEAKIVVLGAQGVGKTSLVMRYCKGAFNPSQTVSTVGASFLAKRVIDSDTDTVVRLQIWDTGQYIPASNAQIFNSSQVLILLSLAAGQERFRSISRLYYRNANACILCYSITDANSFKELGTWLEELRRNLPPDIIIHVVGTKADIVARDSSARQVPFERVIAYVAEHLNSGYTSTPPTTAPAATPRSSGFFGGIVGVGVGGGDSSNDPRQSNGQISAVGCEPRSPSSKRSSGFWAMEAGWDACHEISAESGEGVEEVFRVVTRKLVEQHRQQQALALATSPGSLYSGGPNGPDAPGAGYSGRQVDNLYDMMRANPNGTFRAGDRRSWLFNQGFSGPGVGVEIDHVGDEDEGYRERRKNKCC